MIDTSIKNIPYPWPLDSISLRISSEAPLSGDYTDRGIIEWRGDAYATIYPEGFSEEEEEFSVLSASGLLPPLPRTAIPGGYATS